MICALQYTTYRVIYTDHLILLQQQIQDNYNKPGMLLGLMYNVMHLKFLLEKLF